MQFFVVILLLLRFQAAPTPIHPGENLTGEITSTNPQPEYSLTVNAPESIVVQLLPLSDSAPRFRIIDLSGFVLGEGAPREGETIITAAAVLPSAGTYRILVEGVIGTQYVISAGVGEIIPPPTPLVIAERVSASVETAAPVKRYILHGDGVLFFSVTAESAAAAPVITIYNSEGDVIALVGSAVQGTTLRLPFSSAGYVIMIAHGGSSGIERYSLCAQLADSTPCPAYEPPPEATAEPAGTPAPTLIPSDACVIQPSGVVVNMRRQPTLTAEVMIQLPVEATAPVLGVSPDGIWWLIDYQDFTGWVSSTVTTTIGNCESVQTVFPN